MLKECLLEIINSDLDIGDLRKSRIKQYVERFNEDQLSHLLSTSNGLIAYDLFIYFYPGVGFRCMNDETRTGKLPICNTVQKILNKKYQELS